jgi:rhodanese-related sulfurtransferase
MIDSHLFTEVRSVHEKMQSGDRVFLVDVREPAEYREGHAEGASSIPLGLISLEALQNHFSEWDAKSQPLYLICESGFRALQAAELLYQQGAVHPVVVEGGTSAWDGAQLPMVRKQPEVLSLERQTQIALGVLLMLILVKGVLIHPGFYLLIGLIASGLLLAGITARCSLTGLLARMPWNQQYNTTA